MAAIEWASIMQPLLTVVLLTITLPRAVNSDQLRIYELPGEACDSMISFGDQFKAKSKQIGSSEFNNYTYVQNTDCFITFRTNQYERMYLRVTEFNIEYSTKCTKDKLLIYDGGVMKQQDLIIETDFGLCGTSKSLPNYYYTQTNEVTVKFVTDGDNDAPYRGFALLITPFSEPIENTTTGVSYCNGFRCLQTGKCITQDAYCNGEYQCEDASDEPPGCRAITEPPVSATTQPVNPNTITEPPVSATTQPVNPNSGATRSAAISGFIIQIAWILAWKITQVQLNGDMTL